MRPLPTHLLAAKWPSMPGSDNVPCMASRAGRNVNLIPGVSQDEAGAIHTAYGSYNPVTGEGLPIDAPDELMLAILKALLLDGLDSGPAEPFDWDELMGERFPSD